LRHKAFVGTLRLFQMRLDNKCEPLRLMRGTELQFDIYNEKHFTEFRCKKFEQRIKDQTKDDDV